MHKLFITHFVFLCLASQGLAIQIDQSSATALNTITLYSDSTFVKEAGYSYKAGAYFKVLGESYFEHPDADQKQKFKWYQVETNNKKTGWVFGDGLAVFVPYQNLVPALQPFHRKKMTLGSGFNNAISWIAAIQGRDNFHAQDYMNPLYNEYYLVLTNSRGNSVLMKCSGESARGETFIQKVVTKDITADGFPEFIVQRRTAGIGSSIDEREIEVFTMKAGTLSSIFLEHMTLSYESDVPSPALYKQIEIDDQSIRVVYVDYVLPKNYSQDYQTGMIYPRNERCIEYVTAYYSWDKRTKCFKNLYGESRIAPKAVLWSSSFSIKRRPQFSSSSIANVYANQPFTVIKHYEEYVVEAGRKKIKNWFFIQTQNGKYGYVPAEKVGFIQMEHGNLLNRYYLNPPISKFQWKTNGDAFLLIK